MDPKGDGVVVIEKVQASLVLKIQMRDRGELRSFSAKRSEQLHHSKTTDPSEISMKGGSKNPLFLYAIAYQIYSTITSKEGDNNYGFTTSQGKRWNRGSGTRSR